MQALANTPVTGAGASGSDQPPQILGNLVSISSAMRPAVVSHYDIEPLINVYAAVDGRDLGAVSDEIAERVHDIERSEEHTSELQSHSDLVCRLLLEKKKKKKYQEARYSTTL